MHSVALEAQSKANEVGAIQQLNKTLYLGNIAPTVTDEELKTLFGCMVRAIALLLSDRVVGSQM